MTGSPVSPAPGRVVVFATSWCPYCARLRSDLDVLGVVYDEIDVDADAEAAAFVESVNHGNRVVPTVLFEDGETATNPTAQTIAELLVGSSD